MSLGTMIREMEESGVPQSALQIIWNVIYVTLYVAYDTEQEFMPQFQKKADKLLHDIPELKEKKQAAEMAIRKGIYQPAATAAKNSPHDFQTQYR